MISSNRGLIVLLTVAFTQIACGGRLLPKCAPPADILDVIDVNAASNEVKLAATTLQGCVNAQDRARVYCVYYNEGYIGERFWLNELVSRKYIKGYKHITLDEYFTKYNDCYDTVIVYDPNIPATINVATMIAGLEKGIVIGSPDRFQYGKGKKIIDIRGCWKNNVQAYEWAFQYLWPKMNHKVIASYHPTYQHPMRDYLVANKVFTFWVTSDKAADGVVSSYEDEKRFAEKVFAQMPPNTPVIGFWATPVDYGLSEYGGVGLAGNYGLGTVGSDGCANLSLLGGINVNVNDFVKEYLKTRVIKCPAPDPSKVYVSFVITESGDSPAYWQYVQLQVWSDPNRGKIPIGWSLGPPVVDMMPSVLEWFYRNAAPNDYFYAGLSGTFYVHPYRELFTKTKKPAAAWREYLSDIQYYIDMLKLQQVGLYTDAWIPFDRAKNDLITLKFANGLKNINALIMGMGRDEGIVEEGPTYALGSNHVVVGHVVTRWDEKNVGRRGDESNKWLVDEIRRNTPKCRPDFIYVHALSWSYHPSDLMQVAAQLGDEYVPVSPGDLADLYTAASRQSVKSK